MPQKDTVTSLLREAILLFSRQDNNPFSEDAKSFLARANALLAKNAEAFSKVRQAALDRGLCGKPKKYNKDDRIKIGLEEGSLATRAVKHNLSVETVRSYQKEAKASSENQS